MDTLESRPDGEGSPSCAFMRSDDTGSKGAMFGALSLVGEGVAVAGGAKDERVGVDEPSARLAEVSMPWLLVLV